jgi:hypothetical protein
MVDQNQRTMQDPVAQYPKPPFPKQTQPEPGLTSEMDPRPDHGEEADIVLSYLPDEESDAREVVKEIEATGRKAVTCPGDIS